MATWKPENSMLTQRGVEILNKLKAGIGTMTVTRVVIGSGRIPASKLYLATSISGDIKEVEVSTFNTTEGGSEIVFYVSNTDFIEPYSVHQIGIYVVHSDYIGEQLYHISQCEESDYDTIPSVHDTPVTQGYSVYLEHGNSELVNILVSTQGVVGRDEFDSFKNVMGATNILDNWYLADPVDTKHGFVVPPNTPYFSSMNSSVTRSGTTSFYTTATPVNKQWCRLTISGTTYYCERGYAVRGYAETDSSINGSIDRFHIENICTLITEDGLKLISPTNMGTNVSSVLYQPTFKGNAYSISEFPITVSVLLADGRFASTTITDVNNGFVGKIGDDLSFGLAYLDDHNSWQVFRCLVAYGRTVTIKAVKTEIGTRQTLAHQDSEGNWVLNEVPNHSSELAKCNQHGSLMYAKSDDEITSVILTQYNSMANLETRSFNLKVEGRDLGLDEGTWFLDINRADETYATITARMYDLSGILLRGCSYDSGYVTKWSTIPTESAPLINMVYDATVEE